MIEGSQLVLDLGHRTALGRDDFLVSPANADAVAWLDLWPKWPGAGLVIYGPEGCGKSHLTCVWQEMTGAQRFDADNVGELSLQASDIESNAVILENLDQGIDENGLLHFYNFVVERRGHLLLTARTPPKEWPMDLPDLRSRISALPAVAVLPPDDELLTGILIKLFADRQLTVAKEVVLYIVPRMERSFIAAHDLVTRLDSLALSERRRITVPLVRRILEETGM